ncbi:hypothetical protein EF918_17560 [Streptomyces sp. WAC06614]|nr:hypothetical protein EF918_17560 [Streptomyces sp. WAC06614]
MQQWTGLVGHSPQMLRLPSALAMAGAAAFVALTGRRLFGARAGLVAGLLFALVPSVSRYAQEARGYAFVVLAVAAATFLLLRALDRPTAGRWALYGATVLMAGLFHMVALVFLASHGIIVLTRWWRRRERRWLVGWPVAVAVALLCVLPLVVLGQRQVGRQLGWLTAPSASYVVDVFWRGLFGSTAVSLCFLALSALPLAWTRGRRPALETALVAALPVLLLWIVSQGPSAYFLDRYLLFTLPAWSVLAAAGLTALRPRALTALGLAAVLALGLSDQVKIRGAHSREAFDARAAAAVIAEGYRPGDGFAPLRGTEAYLQFDIAVPYYLPARMKLKDVFVERTRQERGDLYAQVCADPAACIGNVRRVWVVTQGSADHQPFKGFPRAETDALNSTFPRRTVTVVPGMTVTLLER